MYSVILTSSNKKPVLATASLTTTQVPEIVSDVTSVAVEEGDDIVLDCEVRVITGLEGVVSSYRLLKEIINGLLTVYALEKLDLNVIMVSLPDVVNVKFFFLNHTHLFRLNLGPYPWYPGPLCLDPPRFSLTTLSWCLTPRSLMLECTLVLL